MSHSDLISFSALIFFSLVLFSLSLYLSKKKNKKQLEKAFIALFSVHIFWMLGLAFQIFCINKTSINPIYIDYFVYIFAVLSPVIFLLISLIFSKTKITFTKKYTLLLIIPILSLLLLWTNDFHHLFYVTYSTNPASTVFGWYMYIYLIYTYSLYIISLFILMKYSIKNSGFFSKQAILIFIGAIVPVITNIIGFLKIVSLSIYITPITFGFTIICLTLAMFRFDLFKITPIALQTIVDRISDSYVVLNDDYEISDFNETFVKTFNIKKPANIRGNSFTLFLEDNNLNANNFSNCIKKVANNDKTESFEIHINKIDKYFNIEITSILVNGQSLGILILFKDITQHKRDMKTIQDNQDVLMESERLASLGQLVGGIAHNLKTPIMSISGAAEGLTDLVKELDASIGNPVVNNDDFHAIAADMSTWISKIKSHTEYMSDILTAVKGQAVTMSNEQEFSFTIDELLKRVDILMKHELKKAVVYLNTSINVDENTVINGNISSLVQVINNLISNAIQSYNGEPEKNIDLVVSRKDNNIVFMIKDYGCGLPDKVKNKLFKEMITTKGKNGTGLGLYMSYSNIKAHFHGDITFESEEGKGTTFNIFIPV